MSWCSHQNPHPCLRPLLHPNLRPHQTPIFSPQLCDEATREINEKAAWALSKFSTRETLMNKYEVDFSLIDAPDFNSTFGVDSNHKVQSQPKVWARPQGTDPTTGQTTWYEPNHKSRS